MMNRVVITGMGIISPIGNTKQDVYQSLLANRSGIESVDSWAQIKGLRVRVAGRCRDYDAKRINRKDRRTMGPMAIMAALSTLDAITMSGIDPDIISSTDTGVSMGSTIGSVGVIEKIFNDFLTSGGISCLEGTTFMKIMNHSVSANIAAMLKTKGRVLSPCSACSTSTQAIGEGFEMIKNGYQTVMICGGADELHYSTAGVFDVLHAASKKRGLKPIKTPSPFDLGRDGLVVSEGAGALVLEEYEHAKNRGADILGELTGYYTCCDGEHMTSPSAEGMFRCMKGALDQAGCRINEIDYINAHATGTKLGDIAESKAIKMICDDKIPVSATKGFTGHTLAASGVMETIFCLLMMEHNLIIPTLNLETIDPDCDGIFHVQKQINKQVNRVMTSNFAFGGINATLVLQK